MKLLVIDSNALIHRSFHALPALTDPKGRATGGLYGFLLTFFKAVKDVRPDYVVATFDAAAPTFRHDEFKAYKAKRERAPDELYQQIPMVKDVLTSLGVPIFEKEGFEADDVIATIVKKTHQQQIHPKLDVYILTGDSDTLQLVDENTKVYTLGRGVKETVIYDVEKVIEKYSLLPNQMVDFKALAGDPSDNIPGATGIGRKTATEILKKFKSIENLYKQLKKDKTADLKPRIIDILITQEEQVLFSKLLATARLDVPIKFKLDQSKFGNFNNEIIEDSLKKYGFYTLVKRIPELKGDSSTGELNKGKLF
jgi:DNA polymerase-1